MQPSIQSFKHQYVLFTYSVIPCFEYCEQMRRQEHLHLWFDVFLKRFLLHNLTYIQTLKCRGLLKWCLVSLASFLKLTWTWFTTKYVMTLLILLYTYITHIHTTFILLHSTYITTLYLPSLLVSLLTCVCLPLLPQSSDLHHLHSVPQREPERGAQRHAP